MRKSKRGPALFELLSEQAAAEAPRGRGWLGKGRAHPTEPAPAFEPDPADESAPQPEPEPSLAPEALDDAPGPSQRSVKLDGNRIRFSLTSVSAAVAVFAGIVLLLAGFELGRDLGAKDGFRRGYVDGRTSYSAEAMTEIEAARHQSPSTHLVASLLKDVDARVEQAAIDADAGPGGGSPAKWIRDYTYIVAQEFSPGCDDDARAAQAFLARHGIKTKAVRHASGSTQLITAQGYNRRDPAQRQMADELRQKVRAVGAKYYAGGGGYKLEGYFKTLKRDRW